MVDGCRLRPSEIILLSESKRLESNEEIVLPNIRINCSISEPDLQKRVIKTLTVKSRGGGVFKTPVIHQFVTVCKHSRPDLFPQEIGYATCHSYADTEDVMPMPQSENIEENNVPTNHDDHTYCSAPAPTDFESEYARVKLNQTKKKREKKIVGLMSHKRNILHLLEKATLMEIFDSLDDLAVAKDGTSDELLALVLLSNKCQLLPDIITELQYSDSVKWESKTTEDLFPELLTDTECMMRECTVKDLNIICKTLEYHTDRSWYTGGALKAVTVNKISKAFGGKTMVPEASRRKGNKIYNPMSLKCNYLQKGNC